MGLSFWHMMILLVIVLVVFGPNRLPGLGKSMGEAIRGFKKGLGGDEIDVTDTVRREQLKADETKDDGQQTTQKQRDKTHTDT